MISLTVDANVSSSEDLFGKSVDDLQEDIVIGEDSISGTLKAIDDYTGFSGDTELQSGHYLVTHSEADEGATITVEIVGGISGPVQLDDDGIHIGRITSTDQSLRIIATKDGESVTKTFSLSGLTLE